ncbi:uncharacterized protein LOC143893097 [Tasmannia lanceolata]|uniref:uncharacterized protein LOC143893097 n=1 Tax=Tasmannia lanceolata TaxID=3420 RepID=UPI004062E74D
MTAKTSDCNGVLECFKAEFEEKLSLKLNPCEDLENNGDCNGIACEKVEEIELSRECVNGESDEAGERDLDTVRVIDLVESVKTECNLEENGVLEPNVDSVSEENVVECDELMEKGDNGETCVENGFSVNESVFSCSNPRDYVDREYEKPNIDGIGVNDLVDDEKQLETVVCPEENQERQTLASDGVESNLHPLENGEEVDTLCVMDPVESVEVKCNVEEDGVLDQNVGSQCEENVVECDELREKGDDGETCIENGCSVNESVFSSSDPNIDGMEVNDIVDDVSQLESDVSLEENQECQTVVSDDVKSNLYPIENGKEDVCSELHQFENGEEVETSEVSDEITLDGPAKSAMVDAKLEGEVRHDPIENGKEDVGSELHQFENGEEMEMLEVSDVITLDGPANSATVDAKLEGEVRHDPIENGNEDVGSELHQFENGEEMEMLEVSDEITFEGPANSAMEDAKSEGEVRHDPIENGKEDVGSELHQFENGKEMETSEVSNEITLDGPADTATEDAKLEGEFRHDPIENGKDDVGSELHHFENGEEMETSEVSDDITLEGPASSAMEDAKLEGEVRHDLIESRGLESEEMNWSLENKKLETEKNYDLEIEVRNSCVGREEMMPTCPVEGMKPEIEVINGSVETGESIPNCIAEDMHLEMGVRNGFVERGEATEFEAKDINGSVENDQSLPICPDTNIIPEFEVRFDSMESGERLITCLVGDIECTARVKYGCVKGFESLPTCLVDDFKLETNDGIDSIKIRANHVDDMELKSEVSTDSVETVESMPTCPIDDVELEAEGRNGFVEICKNMPSGHVDDAKLEGEDGNGSVGSESTPDCAANVVDLELEDQPTSMDGDEKYRGEDAASADGISSNGILPSPHNDSSASALIAQKADAEMGKGLHLPNFIIRIPRFSDDKIRAQIKLAQSQVDEKTQSRDSIRVAMNLKKATRNECRDNFEAAKLKERAARDAVTVKHREIDSVQSIINKMKNATSIEEIDERIHNMQHMIEHETMHLKEEKKLIHEIKQLKQYRKQLCASMGAQTEIQEAFNQRDSIEERFKLLKKEMDSLRMEVLRTEIVTKAAKKKYYEECDNVSALQAQVKSADDRRQEAYAELWSLKKQLYERNKYFRIYKEDQQAAARYPLAGDKEALQSLCSNQVEKIMELWNKNDEFRNEYVKHNMISTVRRLKTLDGRSLGPDEEPPVLRNPAEGKIDSVCLTSEKINAALPPSLETLQERGSADPPQKADLKPTVDTAPKNRMAKSKKTPTLSSTETGSTIVSSRVDAKEETEKEIKRRKEEDELASKEKELARKEEKLARNEEELKKQEAAAKLKEQRRLEEIAKAKEAEERKRRNAEKAKARAELRAQKEAEIKEKEREKKERKKEMKKAAATLSNKGDNDTDKIVSENAQEPEIKEKPSTTMKKKSVKSAAAAKQTKATPLPLPLRNRRKKRMQPWMWALVIAVIIIVLFLVSNSAFPFKFGLQNLGF